MFNPETPWVTCRQVRRRDARGRPDHVPPDALPWVPAAPAETDSRSPSLTSSELRRRAATASRLAAQIPGDPAAEALRQLAVELERQAAAIDHKPGGCR
jgi:hypothetical protein